MILEKKDGLYNILLKKKDLKTLLAHIELKDDDICIKITIDPENKEHFVKLVNKDEIGIRELLKR